jgi:hypothetical protein
MSLHAEAIELDECPARQTGRMKMAAEINTLTAHSARTYPRKASDIPFLHLDS